MYEDAGCAYPCGMEPMGCPGCEDLGRTTPPKTKEDYYQEIKEREDRERDEEEAGAICSDIEDELDGKVMRLDEAMYRLDTHIEELRWMWKTFGMLCFLGFGFNDGDHEATISVEWREEVMK